MFAGAFTDKSHQPFTITGNQSVAVLLTHGFPGSPKEMRPIAEHIHETYGYTVQGILLPGFGPEIETIPDRNHAEWQQTVMHATRTLKDTHERVILAGNSMGGALSIYAAAHHTIDGLILFAPFWTIDHIGWKTLPFWARLFPSFKPFLVFKPKFHDPEFQRGVQNFITNPDFDDPEFQRQVREMRVYTTVFEQIRAAGLAGYEHAEQVRVPTLVIQGTEDELVRPKTTQKLLNRLGTNLTYVEVNAPHNPLQPELDCWPDVQRHVINFMQQFDTHDIANGATTQP